MIDRFLPIILAHLGFNLVTALAVLLVLAVAVGSIWWQFRELRIKVATIAGMPSAMFGALAWVVAREWRLGAWLAVAVPVGLVAGSWAGAMRARLVTLRIDPTSRIIFVRGTPLSALFWLAVLMVKTPLRFAAQAPAGRSGMLSGCLSAAFLAIGAGSVASARICWYRRYRMAAAVAGQARD